MRFLILRLAFVLTLYVLASAKPLNNDNFVEVHDTKLEHLQQKPPQDPAIHSFPTAPTVPLLPMCVDKGYFRDPFNCQKFYRCEYANDVPAGFYCQSPLIFNTVTNVCDYPEAVQC